MIKITLSDDFKLHLADILIFIAKDSKARSLNFRNELMSEISKLVFMPKSHRKNRILNDENARDLIFKKYIIPFYIFDDEIFVIDIYKHNIPNLKNPKPS